MRVDGLEQTKDNPDITWSGYGDPWMMGTPKELVNHCAQTQDHDFNCDAYSAARQRERSIDDGSFMDVPYITGSPVHRAMCPVVPGVSSKTKKIAI